MNAAHLARNILFLAASLAATAWGADSISVTSVVAFREIRSANSIGVVPGDHLKIGALNVKPNPFHGENGSIGTSMVGYAPGSSVAEPLNFVFSPASPDEFSSSRFFFQDAWADPWTLVVSNPESANSPVTVTTRPVRRADGTIPPPMPFVHDMSLSGDGTNVTFHWTPPAGAPFNNVSIRIWDRDRPTPTSSTTLIYLGTGLATTATSHTPPSVLNASGDMLHVGGHYTVGIQLQESGPFGTISRSASYFNFTPLSPGSPPNAYLPVVGPDGVYNFNATVVAGQTVFVDPEVAVGYEYAIGAGDPSFESVLLPNVGDGLFALQIFDGAAWHAGPVVSTGVPYYFGGPGVTRFRVIGIEPSAGLDPDDVTAFVTGLTFVASGRFTGTMTPLTATPDITPPLIIPVVTGNAGNGGWYTGPVTIAWNVVDPESAITSASCGPTTLTSDTAGTTVGCSATSSGGTTSSSVTIRIDATAPAMTCEATPAVLWPPNNRMVDIAVRVTVSDTISGATGFALQSVTSSDPADGDIAGWTTGTADVAGQLRASRSGFGDGRIYTLVYRGLDAAGNAASCSAHVIVPHDMGR